MKKADVSATLAVLVAAYPRAEIGEATLAVYETMLQDLDLEELQAVVIERVARSPWFPTIAELREAAAEKRLGLPSSSEAAASVQQAVESGTTLAMHPLAREALSSCGGLWEAKRSRTPQIWRQQFLGAYEELRAESVAKANLEKVRANLLTPAARKGLLQ